MRLSDLLQAHQPSHKLSLVNQLKRNRLLDILTVTSQFIQQTSLQILQPPLGPDAGNTINIAYCNAWPALSSAKASRDVVLGLFTAGFDKNMIGCTKFHQFAQIHIGGVI